MADGAFLQGPTASPPVGAQPTSVNEFTQQSIPAYMEMTPEERYAHSKEAVDRHIHGLQKRRLRDLTAEKYLLHVDGENDGQYAEIVDGWSVMVEPNTGNNIRWQRNLLRPLMDNTVAYLTGIPHRVIAKSPPGRRARDKARMDTALGNHLIAINRLNAKLAECMYIAGTYGSCPVHSTWRAGQKGAGFTGAEEGGDGWVDYWVGDPWGTVYDDAATRNKVHRYSYELIIPTRILRKEFANHPDIARIAGRTDLPASSRFQRIVRRWQYENIHLSGSAVLTSGGKMSDELTVVLVDEILPGVDSRWDRGRLMVTALDRAATIDPWSRTTNASSPILLHVGDLPGGRPSITRFYSINRYDDVHGKPYIADLSPLQQQLNQIVSLRAERLRRFSTPQLMAKSGGIEEDSIIADPDHVLMVTSQDYPTFLAPPQGSVDYDALMQNTESEIFRIGGWQAASRGESHAGDAAAKVVALSKADDSIFGPMTRGYQDSLIQLLQTGHALHREFAQKPVMARIIGEDLAYIADPWIRPESLSQEDPNYELVSGFGTSPEALANNLLTMVTTRASDGRPLMTTEEFWEVYPDPSLRPHQPGSSITKRMRLNALNYHIEALCDQSEQEYREIINQNPQMMPQLAQFIMQEVTMVYPVLRTDDPMVCIASLDELVHDVTSSALVRMVAEMRQAIYFNWLAQMEQVGALPSQNQQPPARQIGSTGTPPATSQFGGTRQSDAMSPGRLKSEVEGLTSEATSGAVNERAS